MKKQRPKKQQTIVYTKSLTLPRTNPLTLISQNARHVILGDPGSGKSTLLRFLSLVGISKRLQDRYKGRPDERLPVFITLRRYADELKTRANLSLIRHIREIIQSDFNLNDADQQFFDYYFESGQAMLFFDGLDELPASHFKERVRDQIRTLITTYPGNATTISSRIVGYDNPFRFNEKEFTHHRLTKLRLPEMKQFVEDWYRVRIENERDRADHVHSLVRILENPEQRAIYDLAENPLLLTIIALVHRIDGVLPDARVVLYKICTETLLESWHRWKFKDLEGKNRGREERRNKQRMEAIAHWMQTRSVSTGKTQRAVVPFADLSKFLTSYIKENEKPTEPNDEPQDLADEFLRFVKERAGLLIELGDKEYSFVHLTFQEYLTAAYIKTNSELEGIAKTWERIKSISYEPRWHEVMRLLIAGLDSNAGQEFLVEQLLAQNANGHQSAKAQVLGGLLVDGVEAAENREGDILHQLLLASTQATDVDQLRPTNTVLNLWLSKDSTNADSLCDALKQLRTERSVKRRKQTALDLALVATATGIPKEKQIKLAKRFIDSESIDAELFHLLFGRLPMVVTSTSLIERVQPLWVTQDYYSLVSAGTNLVAAISQSVTGFMSKDIAAVRLFDELLISLFGSDSEMFGPFSEFAFRTLPFVNEAPEVQSILPTPRRINAPDRAKIMFDAIRKVRGTSGTKHSNSVLSRAKMKFETSIGERHASRERMASLRQLLRTQDEYTGAEVFSDPVVHTEFLKLVCGTLSLQPNAQWWEALRMDLLPSIYRRIPQLSGTEWRRVETSFARGTADDADKFLAAWQLVFDAWIYTFEGYRSPDQSPFAKLATLTRSSVAAPLKLAHCIRDLAFGDVSRTDALLAMANSEKPAFRSIFERCYVRDTITEKATRGPNPTRKAVKKSRKAFKKK